MHSRRLRSSRILAKSHRHRRLQLEHLEFRAMMATVSTDLLDYPPGATAIITARDFQVGETVQFQVLHNDGIPNTGNGHEPWTVRDGGPTDLDRLRDGHVRTNWYVDPDDSLNSSFTLTAIGQASSLIATTTFTDANPSADLDQCGNDSAPSPSTDGCNVSASDWVNGNLGESKSSYFEGDSIPYRLKFDNLSLAPATHNVTIRWDTTKAGKHAIDYLTSFNQTVANANPCLGVATCDPLVFNTFAIPADPQVTGGGVTPIAGNFRLYGGTITNVNAYSYPDGPGFLGDKTASITITFTATVADPVLAWGGHIATRADWGIFNSAINISGSPYHTTLLDLDGSGGNQDRSLSAAAVVFPAILQIIKDTVPDSPIDFSFTTTGADVSPFMLDDDADNTLSNTQTFMLTTFGAGNPRTVTESNPGPAWALTGLVCNELPGGFPQEDNSTTNLGTRTATIIAEEGELITCTFTNTLQNGTIIVDKVTNPSGDSQSFSFDASGGSYADFSLTDAAAPNSQSLIAGNYSVSEMVPAGWSQTSATCISSIGDIETPGILELDGGETITCTFTNTQQSQIIVQKQTLPDGSAQSFEFDPSYGANFLLTDGQQNNSGFLAPGSYSVAEVNIPAGWTLSSAVCSDGSPVNAISLQPGEVVTCVFTNTQQSQIIVQKQTLPDGSAQSFEFDPSYGANFFLTDGQQNNSGFLAPGSYSVAEVNIPAGWTLSSAVCSDGSPVNAVSLQPGEVVTCVFSNTQQSQIIVQKQTLPDGSAQSFEFDPSYGANFLLTDGQQNNSGFLAPGSYSVAEVNIPAGWTLSSAVCSDGSPVNAISLQPGEVVTCVFSNTQQSQIIVQKQTLPDGSAQSFEFDPSYGANFLLTDGQQNNSGFLAPGSYSVAEVNIPAGWTLSSAVCSDGSPVNAISLQPGEVVTCVFTNTQQSQIIVQKQTLPDGSAQSFEFDPSYGANFFLTDGQQNNSGFLAPGSYSVAEVNIPAGWTLSSAVCSDGSPVNAISLQPGEVVTCVFTNTQQSQIIVQKQTLPDGSAQSFEFDPSYGANFFLTDGQQNNSGFLAPGSYSVAEVNIPAGWTLSSAVCSDGSPVNAISLQPGEVVTCVFTNTQQSQIIVQKQTLPDGSAQSFEFDPSYGANFFLTDGQQNNSGFLAPGSYSVAEVNIPAGWTLSSAVCSDGSPVNAISLQPGEVVTCVFTNTQQSQIIVQKQTLPDGSAQSFEFDPSYGANFFLTDGQQNNSGFLAPGNYSVAEVNIPAGWTLSSAVCSDGSPLNAISLQPGEVVTCVFTNTQQSQIIVQKQTLPDGSAQSFEFDPSYGANFFLTDGQQNNSGFLAPGSYSVAEVNIPAGWTLSSAVCSDGSPVNAISLQPGEVVTCVFTNTQQSQIIVQKQTLPDGSAQSFEFDPSYGANFFLTDGQQNNSGFLAPGSYSVAEVNIPAGWTLSSAVCSDGSPVNAISLQPGEVVTCVFTNTQQSQIIVQKQTLPDGSAQSFEFDPSYGANFFLTDGQQNNSGFLAPGSYSVAEVNIPAGWTLSSAVCSDGSPVNAISLQPGEVVTCVFTNTQVATVVLFKNTFGGNAAFGFDFTGALVGQGSPAVPSQTSVTTQLGSGQTAVFTLGNLPAAGLGVNIQEQAQFGWDFNSVIVLGDDDSSTIGALASLNVEPGETIIVAFSNTLRGRIIVEKQTIPDGSAQSFEFDPSYSDANFTLTDGQQDESGLLLPGTYSVAELATAGWELSSAVCSDGSPANAIALDAGETVTCVFNNTQQTGTVNVFKNAAPDALQDFTFTRSFGPNFQLDDDAAAFGGDATLPNNISFANVQPGTYTITESAQAGWKLSNIVISDPDGGSSIDLVNRTATLDVDASETITVTFVNTPNTVVITPNKCNCADPAVLVVDATTGELVSRFLAYDSTYQGGVRVATGDLTGDGVAEIVTAPGRGMAPWVRVWDQQGNMLVQFLAFSNTFVGGVEFAVGDVTGDGFNDIAAAMSYNGNKVAVFRNTLVAPNNVPTFALYGSTFDAFNSTFKGGATVELAEMGDFDGGLPRAEVIVGSQSGLAPTVNVFAYSGTTRTKVRTFNPFTPTFKGGMSLDVARINGDAVADIIVGAGNGGSSQVQVLNGQTKSIINAFTAFTALDTPSYNAPIDVAAFNFDANGVAKSILVAQGTDGTAAEIRTFNALTGVLESSLPESAFDSMDDFCGMYFIAALENRELPFQEVFNASTGEVTRLMAYGPTYFGGIRTATGDLNGDGVDEIITAPGRGYKPLVRIFDQNGKLLTQFTAYANTYTGGVDVAVGDVNGDGRLDIATSMMYGGSQVKVFKNAPANGQLAFTAHSSFYPFGSTFKGGAVVQMADLGVPITAGTVKKLDLPGRFDGKAEIIVGNLSGMRSTVKAFTYYAKSPAAAVAVRTYLPFASTFRGGVSLAVGQVVGDKVPDIIVGAGRGGGSQVQILNGATTAVARSFNAFSAGEADYNAKVDVEAQGTKGAVDFILAAREYDGKSREIRRFRPLTGELVDTFFDNYSGF